MKLLSNGISLKEVLIPFPITAGSMLKATNMTNFHTQVYTPTFPLGLIIWGATEETFIEAIRVGNYLEGSITGHGIPAKYFEGEKTFEQLMEMAEKDEIQLSVKQRQVLRMSPCYPGQLLNVDIRGPFSNFCMWGVQPSGTPDPAFATIEKVEVPASSTPGGDKGRTYWIGRIVRPRFAEEDLEQLRVEGPTSSDVATMMAPAIASSGIRGITW